MAPIELKELLIRGRVTDNSDDKVASSNKLKLEEELENMRREILEACEQMIKREIKKASGR